jgi:phage terminase large subunit
MRESEAEIILPDKLADLFSPPRGAVQYRGARGGRGSGKSFSFAKMAATWGYAERLRVLCVREYQASIKESFHAELKAAIESEPWLSAAYDVGVDYLKGRNGTEFIFRGLHRSLGTIKSTAKIDLTIVEEAEDVPEGAWLALLATVLRKDKSEAWVIWNPSLDGSPVDNRFVKNPPESALIVELNWWDNPFFPVGLDLLRRQDQARLDPATYAHVWEGAYLVNSVAQVLHGKVSAKDFTPAAGWDGPYYGADWGFSQDPTAAVRCWVNDGRLFVEHEAYGAGVELDELPTLFDAKLPGVRQHVMRGDSARPETISHLRGKGFHRLVAADTWPGSVEDGIAFLRGFLEIVVHPRCVHTLKEARLWSYKVDKLTGDVLPVLVDAHNHAWDAVRYALQPIIRKRHTTWGAMSVPGL